MSLDKIELKRLLYQELGREFAEQEEPLKSNAYRLHGGKAVLEGPILQLIQSVQKKWNLDFEEEKVARPEYEAALKACDQCAGGVRNLILKTDMELVSAQGQVTAMERIISSLDKKFTAEGKKAEAMLTVLEDGDEEKGAPGLRVVGMHPGQSEAQKRKAAAAAPAEVVEETPAVESESSPAVD
jgi:hypothetical protein